MPGWRASIPSPNALSTQLIVPTMVLAAAVVLARDVRLRVIALAALVPVAVAQYLTYSRAPFLAAYVFVVIVAWRFRRWVGIAVLILGLVGGALALPAISGSASSSVARARCHRVDPRGERRDPIPGLGRRDPDGRGPALRRSGLSRLQGARGRLSATRSWGRHTTSGCGSSPRRASSSASSASRSSSRPRSRWPACRAGWGQACSPGWIGYVIAASFNNPLLFVRGQRGGVCDHRRRTGPCRSVPVLPAPGRSGR